MSANPHINFTHPANEPILAYLHIESPQSAQIYAPDQVDWYALGTHPDLVEYLWKLGKEVDPDTPVVIDERSSPLLAHSQTGVIFALASGTHTMALRLPMPEYSEMMAVEGYGDKYEYPTSGIYAKYGFSNIVFANEMDEDWVLVATFDTRNPDLIRRAYEYAGTL